MISWAIILACLAPSILAEELDSDTDVGRNLLTKKKKHDPCAYYTCDDPPTDYCYITPGKCYLDDYYKPYCKYEKDDCKSDYYCKEGYCKYDDYKHAWKCDYKKRDCRDGDYCTKDYCDEYKDECVHVKKDCKDGDKCTYDYCKDGRCYHKPRYDYCGYEGDHCSKCKKCCHGYKCKCSYKYKYKKHCKCVKKYYKNKDKKKSKY